MARRRASSKLMSGSVYASQGGLQIKYMSNGRGIVESPSDSPYYNTDFPFDRESGDCISTGCKDTPDHPLHIKEHLK